MKLPLAFRTLSTKIIAHLQPEDTICVSGEISEREFTATQITLA